MDPEFPLLADALWLDFVNTGRGPHDLLPDLDAYHRWTKACRLPSDAAAMQLPALRRVRLVLEGLAEALVSGRAAAPGAVEMLNDVLRESEGAEQLVREGGSWRLRFQPGVPAVALVAVGRSAAEVLAAPDTLVRHCAGQGCRLLFLDRTPGGTRMFCSDHSCGRGHWVERRRAALT